MMDLIKENTDMTKEKRCYFIGSCIYLDGEAIREMQAQAKRITRRTFIRHIGKQQYQELEASLGYADSHLTLAKEPHVEYFRSTYEGRKCYYMTHSRIEYVYCVFD